MEDKLILYYSWQVTNLIFSFNGNAIQWIWLLKASNYAVLKDPRKRFKQTQRQNEANEEGNHNHKINKWIINKRIPSCNSAIVWNLLNYTKNNWQSSLLHRDNCKPMQAFLTQYSGLISRYVNFNKIFSILKSWRFSHYKEHSCKAP